MPNPVTIGAFVVSVLVKAIEAGAGEFAKGAGKGAFDALKGKIAQWAGGKVTTLEAAPDSEKTQNAIAEAIDRQTAQERDVLRVLAEALIDELKAANHVAPMAIDIGELEAKRVNLPPMDITEGVGFHAYRVKVDGEFTGQQINLGKK